MADSLTAELLSELTRRLLNTCNKAVEGLSADQLSEAYEGKTNSIGFDVWHVARTVDNIIHFVFEREQPVWLQMQLNEKWGLPRVTRTGMDAAEALALRFPAGSEMSTYTNAVRDAVVPKIAAMSDEYLATTQRLMPFGEITRAEAIGQVLISHGNGHLGRVDLRRSLLGMEGLGY